MKPSKWLFAFALFLTCHLAVGQAGIDSIKFFLDEKPVELTLTTDIRSLQTEKKLNAFQPANVTVQFPDSTTITEDIRVAARGHYRRQYCVIPPLWLNFHNPSSPKLNKLGKLKLVIGCGSAESDEQLIIKEYLTYKAYNLLAEKSYRVRLVRVNYRDTRNKVRPFSQYAFFIEDDKDLARRNDCVTKPDKLIMTENTHRTTMTMVAVFEYMVSNGDWSVPQFHNIHVIYSKKDENIPPYAVPYDFDHSGLVNASYALPPEIFGTETVRERVYRGFPRSMEELQSVFDIYRKQKENIYDLFRNSPYLKDRVKKDAISYLGEFFDIIENKNQVKSIFIDEARKD